LVVGDFVFGSDNVCSTSDGLSVHFEVTIDGNSSNMQRGHEQAEHSSALRLAAAVKFPAGCPHTPASDEATSKQAGRSCPKGMKTVRK